MENLNLEYMDQKFILKMKLEGASITDIRSTRFTIFSERYHISYPGIIEGEEVIFNINNVDKLLEAKKYNYKYEIIIGENYFTPMEGEIIFNKKVKIEATTSIMNPTITPKMEVNIVNKEEIKITPKSSKPKVEEHKNIKKGRIVSSIIDKLDKEDI